MISGRMDKGKLPPSTNNASGRPTGTTPQPTIKTGDTAIWGRILSLIENPGSFANFLANIKEILSSTTKTENQMTIKDHSVMSLGTKNTIDYMSQLQEKATKAAEANQNNPSITENIENNLKQTITDIATLQKKESEVRDLRTSNFNTNDRSKLQELHQGERELNILRASQANKDRETRNERLKMSIALASVGHELMGIGEIKDKNVLYPDIVAQCKENIDCGGYKTIKEFVDDFTTKILERAKQETNSETQQTLKENFKSAIAVKYTKEDIKSGLYPWSSLSSENRTQIEAFSNS